MGSQSLVGGRQVIGYLMLVIILSMPAAFAFSAPLFKRLGADAYAQATYEAFAPFCHQLDDRSLLAFGYKVAVCARCTGVYSGLILSALVLPLYRGIGRKDAPEGWILLMSFAPLLLDGSTQLIGLRQSTNAVRFATGLVFGAGLVPYLAAAVSRLTEWCPTNPRPVTPAGRWDGLAK